MGDNSFYNQCKKTRTNRRTMGQLVTFKIKLNIILGHCTLFFFFFFPLLFSFTPNCLRPKGVILPDPDSHRGFIPLKRDCSFPQLPSDAHSQMSDLGDIFLTIIGSLPYYIKYLYETIVIDLHYINKV